MTGETERKAYYVISVKTIFEEDVLVPVDSVDDIDFAIDLVDCSVEIGSVNVLHYAQFEITQSPYANAEGIVKLSEQEAALYQIVVGPEDEEMEEIM